VGSGGRGRNSAASPLSRSTESALFLPLAPSLINLALCITLYKFSSQGNASPLYNSFWHHFSKPLISGQIASCTPVRKKGFR